MKSSKIMKESFHRAFGMKLFYYSCSVVQPPIYLTLYEGNYYRYFMMTLDELAAYDESSDYGAPSLEFELKTGLSGIHTPWKMPDNLPHHFVEKQIFLDLHKIQPERPVNHGALNRVLCLLDTLISLNPELGALEPVIKDDPDKIRNAIFGITSQFNLDDITYFLTTSAGERLVDRDRLRQENIATIRAGTYLGWFASKPTLQKIGEQLDANPAYKPIPADIENDDRLCEWGFDIKYLGLPILIGRPPGRPQAESAAPRANISPA